MLAKDQASCKLADKCQFGQATDFLSYTWHGTTCGALLRAIQGLDDGSQRRYWWIDVLAVAQNRATPHQAAQCAEDLAFETVIKKVPSQAEPSLLSPLITIRTGQPYCGIPAALVLSSHAAALLVRGASSGIAIM